MSVADTPSILKQRNVRHQVLLGAEISQFGGEPPTKHRIKDLSVSGARVDRATRLKPGSTVIVSVGILEAVGATVIWVKDGAAGLKFAEPIDLDEARSKAIIPPGSQLSLKLRADDPRPPHGPRR